MSEPCSICGLEVYPEDLDSFKVCSECREKLEVRNASPRINDEDH